MRLKRTFGIMLTLLAILPELTVNYAPQVEAYGPTSREVTTAPNNPYHIFSYNDEYLFIGTGDGKVYRSNDDGETWTLVLDTGNSGVDCYLLESDAQGNIYASFDDKKLYRSNDNGTNWTVVFQSNYPPVYFPTGEFFDMKNGTILAAARSDEPLLYRSNDWGINWNLWINFSQVFPEYARPDPSNPSNKAMKHLHLVTYFNGSIFVSTGEYIRYHFKSVGSDLTRNASWRVDFLSTFASHYTMDDRVLLGVDMGDSGIWMYKDGEYKKVYNPHKDVAPYIVFKHFAHDLENDIIYVPIGYSFDPDQTILASPDKGETWFNFINITQTQNYGIVQVEVHKNYLWYVTGYRTYRLPKPSRAELINSVKADTLSFNAYENVYSFTSSVGKAYKNVNVTLSNLTWTNLAPNPSFETFSDSNPTNWTFYAGHWSGTASRGEETSDVYHGSKAYYMEVTKGNGSLYINSNVFSVDAGYYYLGIHFKADSSWFRGAVKFALYAYTDGWKQRTLNLHSINGAWQQAGLSFYLATTQKAKIYLCIESPNDFNLTARVIFDSVILVSGGIDKAFQLDYWTGNLTSTSGSIEINGETFDFSSLPTTISLTQYVVGEINATLTNAKLVNLTLTGTEVVSIQNGSLTGFPNNVYKGRHYTGFSITKNTENKLMVLSDQLSTVNSISLFANKLSFTVSAPLETTSTTKVYCGNKGEPTAVYAANGTLSWSYNATTKILTLNLLHYGPSAEIIIDWKVGDLNALMFEEFQKWDALCTRYLSTNATVSDMWDYTRAPNNYDKPSLSSPTTYFIAMASFYEATGNQYYLNKIRVMVDTYITNTWYRANTDQGTIFYVPKYWIDGFENDPSAMATMMAGVLAIKLYQWTGEAKYKDLADRIATESLKFLAVNNSTDMAWVPGYYITPRDEATAKIGVNRQGTIADFYSLYSQYSTTFASYVPKIINWMWRSQISNGGLGYNIGDTSPHKSYTAYSLYHALRAYKNVPTEFGNALKTKINNTLTWIANQAGTSWYSTNWIYTAVFALAVKSNFLSTPSLEYLNKTKTYLYATLNMMHYSQKGATYTLIDYPFGYRWQELFTGALFSVYPLPNNLATFTSPKVVSENYWTGRYYWHGWALGLQTNSMYVADIYGNTGWYQYPYYLFSSKKSGTATRRITDIGGIFQAWANYSDTKILTYFYPEGIIFTNSSGASQILLYSGILTKARLRVENGTEYNLETMMNGTKILSNNFMVWRNTSDLGMRKTAFVRCSKTTSWLFIRGNSYYQFTTDLTNYNVTMVYLLNWQFTKNASNTFSVLRTLATQHESSTPLTFAQIINNYKNLLEAQEPTPSWLTLYQTATASTPQLIAHNQPQIVSISAWNYHNSKLTFTISASSEINSTTKIYCGDNGKPTKVYAKNGTLAWSYNASAMTLTLNVTQVGPVKIVVDWSFLGDVDGDGDVDLDDLYYVVIGYGMTIEDAMATYGVPPGTDVDGDGWVDLDDLYYVLRDYGT